MRSITESTSAVLSLLLLQYLVWMSFLVNGDMWRPYLASLNVSIILGK